MMQTKEKLIEHSLFADLDKSDYLQTFKTDFSQPM